ncbi:MAG: hypothetical protein GXO63_01960, partial [Candidatus Micrarchaeota archaeon]|nr:hypothetical protein [Candidatus Micrarchaeota archaeon]
NDLSDVPRYQPSVRTSFTNDTYENVVFVSIEYYTQDTFQKVKDFYLGEMSKYGWKLVREEASPGIELPFYGVTLGETRTLDFRKKDCTDPETCLPYAKITLTEFRTNDNSYTYIGIDYEMEIPGTSESGSEGSGTVSPVEPASDFGRELHLLMGEILNTTFGEAVLTSYNEMGAVVLEYTLSSAVEDVSTAVKSIREGLVAKGIPDPGITVTVEQGSGVITFPMQITGEECTVVVNIEEGLDTVSVGVPICMA